MRYALFSAIGLALLAVAVPCVQAADDVVVSLADGRSLRGVVDSRSDEERLWVRQEAGGVVLATAVAWGNVATATLAGVDVDVERLKQQLGGVATAGPRWFADAEATVPIVRSGEGFDGRQRWGRPARVRTVEIVEACLVNLDRDVEPDGLRVSIAAIDETGTPVPVRGYLTARLYTERRPAHFPDIEFALDDDWSQRVAESDFVDGLATYELRFRHTAPEWQFDLLPDAVLEVRLGAHGEGNFAASAPVLIREFNPLRDNQQLFRGTRFLPGELHGRAPGDRPVRRDGLWMHWTW